MLKEGLPLPAQLVIKLILNIKYRRLTCSLVAVLMCFGEGACEAMSESCVAEFSANDSIKRLPKSR